MDDLEMELDNDNSQNRIMFRGTGNPGRPSNLNMFPAAPKKSVVDIIKEQDRVELLVTEAQVLRARAEKKEKEAMKRGMK